MSKILLIGKTGQLGNALLKDALVAGHDVVAPDKNEVNILNPDTFQSAMVRYKPELIINAAAYNNVLQCEKDPSKTFQMNCIAVHKMAAISDEFNTTFITFSSDYVFNGNTGRKLLPYTESDNPVPLQIYGISKLAGELCTLLYMKSIIIRTCALYGFGHTKEGAGNFVDNRIKDAQNCKRLEVGNDQTISPTYALDLSKAVLQLVYHPMIKPGIYHLVNEGVCTWYEFTKEIYNIMDIDIELIPVDRKGRSGTMRRPLYSALANIKAKKLGIELPHWKDGLKRYLREKYKT